MSLQFVFGNSGSGKSGYLYDRVLSEARERREKDFLILVPEQFTMQTQRELVTRDRGHAIMNVDVLSFARLAYRVFDELGMQNLVILEETGKNLLLRKVAGEKRGELRVLGANMDKMGYVGEAKSLISEMAQYGVAPEDLDAFIGGVPEGDLLGLKLRDISTLYRGLLSCMEGKYVTAEEVLGLLCDVAGDSALLAGSVIALDEFTGFTPVQNRLLRELLKVAERVIISVSIDVREDFYHCRGVHELFAMPKKTIKDLLAMAEEERVPVEDPVILEAGEEKRYKGAPSLFFMEQNLFRPRPKSRPGEAPEIHVASLQNPREEVAYAALKIATLVREKGYRYRDFAVVSGAVGQVANYVPEIFSRYGIPYFIDQTQNILFQPFLEFVRGALEAVETDFSYQGIFRFLRCGLCGGISTPEDGPLLESDIDIMENYVLARRIRGIKQWEGIWASAAKKGKKGGENEDANEPLMQRINRFRERIATAFSPLFEAFRGKGKTVAEETMALYDFICSLGAAGQLRRREEELRGRGVREPDGGNFAREPREAEDFSRESNGEDLAREPRDFTRESHDAMHESRDFAHESRDFMRESHDFMRLAEEYSQIYKIVMDLLDKMVSLLGDETLSIREYGEILDAGFDAATVGTIPPGNDRVVVGDIERTRLTRVKVLLFIGVNDGIVPKQGDGGGILSQLEREKMEERGLRLAPGERERVFIQRYYLYLNLSKPSDALYMTYARVGPDGKAMRRSYLIGTMKKLFPDLAEEEPKAGGAWDGLLTPDCGMDFFLEGLRRRGDGVPGAGMSAHTAVGGDAAMPERREEMTDEAQAAVGEAVGGDAATSEWRGEMTNKAQAACEECDKQAAVEECDKQAVGAARWAALAAWYLGREPYASRVSPLFSAAFGPQPLDPIGRALARAVYGSVLENSVTRLERFAACAFSHFMDYGLRLRERETGEFASADMGNLYHDAIERFSRRIASSKEYGWFDLPDGVREAWARESMDEAIMSIEGGGGFSDARSRYLLKRMQETMQRAAWAIVEQVKRGSFVPSGFEVSFAEAGDLKSARIALGEGDEMRLRGRIDRVDSYEEDGKVYVRIIDYKSGNTTFSLLSFYHGLDLQLVVYLDAALEMAGRRGGGAGAVPAGIFYFHVADPVADGDGGETMEEIEGELLELLRLNGLVNGDPGVIGAMDRQMEAASPVIPVSLKSDGTPKASSKIASTEDFYAMARFAEKKLAEGGRRIISGEVAPSPYELAGRTACDYCRYRAVCGFDERLPGFSYRRLERFDSAADVLERLRSEAHGDSAEEK